MRPVCINCGAVGIRNEFGHIVTWVDRFGDESCETSDHVSGLGERVFQ